jgi:hypothetical protein
LEVQVQELRDKLENEVMPKIDDDVDARVEEVETDACNIWTAVEKLETRVNELSGNLGVIDEKETNENDTTKVALINSLEIKNQQLEARIASLEAIIAASFSAKKQKRRKRN